MEKYWVNLLADLAGTEHAFARSSNDLLVSHVAIFSAQVVVTKHQSVS